MRTASSPLSEGKFKPHFETISPTSKQLKEHSAKSNTSKVSQQSPQKFDILVFGDDGAGKRTFMEQFTHKRVLKDTIVSKTC